MSQKKFLLSTQQISKGIAHFTIGFARLTASKTAEDAESAGSGTLVTIGSLHGVLTAAHVLDALPKKGAVGIVTFVDRQSDFQKQIVMMENTEEVVMRGKDLVRSGRTWDS